MLLEAEWRVYTDINQFIGYADEDPHTILDCAEVWNNEAGESNNWIVASDYGFILPAANMVRDDGALWRNWVPMPFPKSEMVITIRAVVETEDSSLIYRYAQDYSSSVHRAFTRPEPQNCRVSFRRNRYWQSIAPTAVNI